MLLNSLPKLPDFLAALQDQVSRRATSPSLSTSLLPSSPSKSQLRYKAYDAPTPAPKLRTRGTSHSTSSRSETFSEGGSRASSRLSANSIDPLSRTVTAGELALAAGGRELEMMTKVGLKSQMPFSPNSGPVEEHVRILFFSLRVLNNS